MSTGILIDAQADGLGALGEALLRMAKLGANPAPIMADIAAYGEQSTRLRFRNQAGPDGRAWLPSKRVKKRGGMTLQLTTRLLRSVSHRSSINLAEWGSNVVYARIHQGGGKIERLAFSSTLRLRTGRGGALLRQENNSRLAVFAKASHKRAVERRYTVEAHSINMPARPFVGINADDGRELLRLATIHVDQAAANRGGAR